MGDTISVTPAPDSTGDWQIDLEYRGGATASPRGERSAAGQPYPFSYRRFEPTTEWSVRYFAWADLTDPRGKTGPFGGAPLVTGNLSRLDYQWFRPAIAALPRERWALEATTTVTLRPGEYTLRTISDDGVRVWIDGVLTIDHWDGHESAVDSAPITSGRHRLKAQYYQVDGWTELRVEIVPGSSKSEGSPGPH